MENRLTPEQHIAILLIANKFMEAAKKSNKETAFQDADRKGMDAIRKYCRTNDLPVLGDHMVRASLILGDY